MTVRWDVPGHRRTPDRTPVDASSLPSPSPGAAPTPTRPAVLSWLFSLERGPEAPEDSGTHSFPGERALTQPRRGGAGGGVSRTFSADADAVGQGGPHFENEQSSVEAEMFQRDSTFPPAHEDSDSDAWHGT